MVAELITLLLSPITFLLRKRRATREEISRFYRSAAWKRARYEALSRSPACLACGRSARDGAKMNVDHIKPLSKPWDLRLDQRNLQTMCASCNWGKGGTEKTGGKPPRLWRLAGAGWPSVFSGVGENPKNFMPLTGPLMRKQGRFLSPAPRPCFNIPMPA
jgi:hypothetical protein